MRNYPKNSPQAAARFIAMTLLADGQLDTIELKHLERMPELEKIGLDGEQVGEVLRDFCIDIGRSLSIDSGNNYQLKPAVVTRLLADIDDPALQHMLCRIALNLIGADQLVHRGESILLWAALDAWDLHLADCIDRPDMPFLRRALSSVPPVIHPGT